MTMDYRQQTIDILLLSVDCCRLSVVNYFKIFFPFTMVVMPFVATQTIAASVTGVGGDTEITIGTDDPVPGTADVKVNRNLWDDAW